jgi:hypothetical protein
MHEGSMSELTTINRIASCADVMAMVERELVAFFSAGAFSGNWTRKGTC